MKSLYAPALHEFTKLQYAGVPATFNLEINRHVVKNSHKVCEMVTILKSKLEAASDGDTRVLP